MSEQRKKPLGGKRLVNAIVAAAEEKLAEEIVILDCRKASGTADYVVVCQSSTTVQNRAIADAVSASCAAKGARPWHREGEEEGRWVLLDFSDVVVHVMLPALRAFYSLETLHSGGRRIEEE